MDNIENIAPTGDAEDDDDDTYGSSGSSYSSSSGSEDDEEEILHAMAEQAKEDVRRQLRELRAVYRSIKQRNNEIPEKFRIPPAELKLPRDIYAEIYAKIEFECDEVYRVHEYESAATIIQLDKLKKVYFDPIETPNIVVKDISHVLQVHTIRNKKTTPEFEAIVKKNKEILEEEERLRRENIVITEAEVAQEIAPIKRVYAEEIIGPYEEKFDTYNVETKHNIRQLERRLAQKYEKECAWRELMSRKVPADFISHEDSHHLTHAKHMPGAYQLQSAASYAGEEISVAERRQRIIEMKLEMRKQVREFNKMVLEARDEKPLVIQECRRIEREIRQVHVLLPEEYKRKIPPIFEMEIDETPESLMDITIEEVEAEEQSLLAAAGLQNIAQDIMDEFFEVEKPDKLPYGDEEEANGMFVPTANAAARAARQARTIDVEFELMSSHRCRKAQFNPRNELEKKRFEVQFYPRLYRQQLLFKELNRVINYFQERIKYLHDLKVKIEIESRVKTVALLTMICELDICKETNDQEETIAEMLRVQRAECNCARKQMEQIKKKLAVVNADIKKCEDELKSVVKDTELAIGQKNRFGDFLWKVFRKKIDVESEMEEEEEEEDAGEGTENTRVDKTLASSISMMEKKKDDISLHFKSRLNLDVCPPHCNKYTFARVVELRCKRVVAEKALEAHKKVGDQITAEYSEAKGYCTRYQERSTEVADEIHAIHLRRQKRMNDLKLMAILRVDQIQCVDLDDLVDMESEILERLARSFPGASNIVLFPKDGTSQLEKRASDLLKKGKVELNKFKKGEHMLMLLHQEYHRTEKEVQILKEEVKHQMEKKFGQEIDLDKLTSSVINLEMIELERQMQSTKTEHYKERVVADKEVAKEKYELTKKIQENSKYNMLEAVMLERRRDLEYYIWKQTKAKGDSASPSKDMLSHLKEPSLPETSVSTLTNDSDPDKDLDDEMKKAKQTLAKQNMKIQILKNVLKQCRLKTGIPPLIPIPFDLESTVCKPPVLTKSESNDFC